MSDRNKTNSDSIHPEDKEKEEKYYQDEIDEAAEDYFLDDEIDEDDEDYFFDEEEEEEEPQEESARTDTGRGQAEQPRDIARTQVIPDVIEVRSSTQKDAAYDTDSGRYYDDDYEEDDDFEEEDEEIEFEDIFEEEEPKKKNKKSGKKKGRKKKSMKKLWIITGSVVAAVAAVYIGVSVFFMSHFFMNTEINGHDFSGKTPAEVEAYMKEQVDGYQLEVKEKDNKSDTIAGSEISLTYKENDDIKQALKKQNGFLWPAAFFSKNSAKVTVEVSYDQSALDSKIQSLQAVTAEQVPAQSAYPKFDGEKFVIEPEVIGTAVNMDVLKEKVHQYISEFQAELDMEKEKCYAEPRFTSESEEVKKACDTMNNYCKASITYTMTEREVVDKTLISTWVTADENMNVTFNEEAVKSWLTEFGDKYDTVGTTRTIVTPTGKSAEVSGGTYGWSIDEDTEFEALTNSIKNGETVEKEPAYYQTAAAHAPADWGNTYAEVDLSAQHMWYIVDGAVALETDVVTGYPSPEKETPAGVYNILEIQRNKTLVGEIDPSTGEPEYETPVSFWMRVTWSGIGFHDATWQPGFGGSLYTSIGSHGCINMPYGQAEALFNMIGMGTPVIIHY